MSASANRRAGNAPAPPRSRREAGEGDTGHTGAGQRRGEAAPGASPRSSSGAHASPDPGSPGLRPGALSPDGSTTTTVPMRGGWLRRLDLGQQYLLASLPVLVLFVLGLGWWVSRSIESHVIHNVAANVALYVQSFVAPVLEDAADRDELTGKERAELTRLLRETPLGQKILSVKVWKPGGLVVYYSRGALEGRLFSPSPSLRAAWRTGEVQAEFEDLSDEEDSIEARLGLPLLEVYAPLRDWRTGEVRTVVEFYQDASRLVSELRRTRTLTWAVVGGAAGVMYGLLFLIVQTGSRTIRRQRATLRRQVDELSRVIAQNQALHERVRRATRGVTEQNEQYLRRVSAELHDGPAQALGLALLRLDTLRRGVLELLGRVHPGAPGPGATGNRPPIQAPSGGAGRRPEAALERDLLEIREAVESALTEVRQISRGLALPELATLDLAHLFEEVSMRHARRTRTPVELHTEGLTGSVDAPLPVKLTAWRVVQESLMNAFRHAEGKGQRVTAAVSDERLFIEVADSGPGLSPAHWNDPGRLGLRGLRERVESLGGLFDVRTGEAGGTIVSVVIPLGSA